MIKDQKIFLTTQMDIDVDLPEEGDFYEIGTICKIKQMLKLPGDAIRVLVEGLSRAKIAEVLHDEPYFKASIQVFDEEDVKDKETEALMRACVNAFERYISVSNRVSPDVMVSVSTIEQPGRFADTMASHMVLKTDQKQQIIEAVTAKERLEVIYEMLLSEIEILEVEKDINDKVRSQINQLQKEYYLREQLKVIREELGEDHSGILKLMRCVKLLKIKDI